MDKKIINDRYVVIRNLSEGGMGLIYLVEDILYGNKKLVLKTINDAYIKENIIDRFKREFDIMTRLKHPNLISVYDFGQDKKENIFYITMEYIEGKNLKDYILEEKKFSEDVVLEIIVTLCRTLEFIHSRKILHRDIKPSNIIIYKDKIKLMDFGLADLEDIEQNETKGTLIYMAPEVINKTGIDKSTDIFSLGMTFFELITGSSFYPEKRAKIVINILKDRQIYEENLEFVLERVKNHKIREIIAKMLSYKKEYRYASCAEIISDINEKLRKNYLFETDETKEAYILGTNFIGREKELELMKNRLNDNNYSKLLVIKGVAGVGKRRLFKEFKKFCQINNYIFIEGNCLEFISSAYEPFINILNEIILKIDNELLNKYWALLKKLIPHHFRLHLLDTSHIIKDIEFDRDMIISSISNLLIEFALRTDHKIILYISDIQNISKESLNIIEDLLFKISKKEHVTNLKIFASFEESEKEISDDIFSILKSKDRIEEIILAPFTSQEVKTYINEMFGLNVDDAIYENIVKILEKIGGNPLFLQEMIKSLVEENIIIKGPKKWEAGKLIHKTKAYNSIKAIVCSRYYRLILNSNEKKNLQILALLGRGLYLDEVNKLFFKKNDSDHLAFLSMLERKEFLVSKQIEGRVEYNLSNYFIKEIILENMRSKEKREIHQHIAEYLEKTYNNNIEDYIEEITYHYLQAKNIDKSIIYLEKAAAKSHSNYLNLEALDYYSQLLDLLGENKNKKVEILIERGLIFKTIGKWDESYYDFNTAMIIAEEIGDNLSLVKAKGYIGNLEIDKGNYKTALNILESALEISIDNSFKNYQSIIIGWIGLVYWHLGDHEKAMEYYEQQLEISNEINNKDGICQALCNMGLIFWQQGENDKAMEEYQKLLQISQEINNLKYASDAYGNIGLIYWSENNLDSAMEYFKKKLELAELLGSKKDIIISYINIGNIYADKGDYTNAMDYYQRHLELSEELGDKLNISLVLGNIGTIYEEQGRYDIAREYYEKKLKISEELSNKQDISIVYCNLADIFRSENEYEKALEYYDKAIAIGRDLKLKYYLCYFLYNKGITYFYLNNLEKAEAYIYEAYDISKTIKRSDILFMSSMFKEIIKFHKSKSKTERELAIKNLENMLNDAKNENSLGMLCAELYRLTKKKNYKQKALEIYKKLYDNIKKIEYKKIIDELEKISDGEIDDGMINSDSNSDDRKKSLELLREELKIKNDLINKKIEEIEKELEEIKYLKFEDEKISKEKNFLKELLKIVREINSNLTLKELLIKIVDLSIEFIEADRGVLFIFDKNKNLEIKAARNKYKKDLNLEKIKISKTVINRVISTGEPIFEANVKSLDFLANAESVIDINLQSVMCIPLFSRVNKKELLGILYVDSESNMEESKFSKENIEYFYALGEQASIAISNTLFYEKMNVDELTGLYLRSYFDKKLDDEIIQSYEFKKSLIVMLVNIDSFRKINEEYGYNVGDQVLKKIAKLFNNVLFNRDIVARYSSVDIAILLPRLDIQTAELIAEELLQKVEKETFDCGKVTISVGISEFNGESESKDIVILKNLLIKRAEQALIASKKKGGNTYTIWEPSIASSREKEDNLIKNIITGDSLKDYRNVEMLLQAIEVAHSTLDLKQLLINIMNIILKITGAERGLLMLFDEKINKLKIEVALDKYGNEISEDIIYSKTIPYSVYKTGNSICIKDSKEEEYGTESMMNYDIRSVMCIPISVKGKNIGVIYVDSNSDMKEFHESDLAYFYALTNQISGAIENARLYKETIEKSEIIAEYNKNLLESNLEIETLKNYLSNIIESMPSLLIVTDINGIITRWNKAVEKYTEIKSIDAYNKLVWDVFPELTKYKKCFYEILTDYNAKEILREVFFKDKEKKYFNISIFPVITSKIEGIVFRIDDITDIEKKEEQLRQAQKMEIIGTLSGGLAHDFNNILGGILGVLSLIEFKISKGVILTMSEIKEYINTMLISTNRATSLVQQLLALSRKQELVLVPTDLNLAIKHIVKLCQNTFDKKIEIISNYYKEPAMVFADPAQLEQVLLNFCVNANHAMTIMRKENENKGGILSINLDKVYIDKEFCKYHLEAKEDYYWLLSISDTGVGMSKEIMEKIFDPFFTTKPQGLGTGLGLSMVYNIIKQHNGFINVYSEVGIGTTFNVYLPVYKGENTLDEKQEENKIIMGEGSILVIDDDELIRNIARSILETCGYTVITACDGEEGVAIYREKYKEIKLVLLDLIMPKKSGEETLVELKKIYKSVKIILTSGFRSEERIKSAMEQGADDFISKPFTIEKLSKSVDQVLKKSKSIKKNKGANVEN